MKERKKALSVTRSQDYARWYQEVIEAADLAEHSPARGCMILKPYGYALWEKIQKELDQRIKKKGVQNAYFPLFIPLSFLEKEAKHVEGFAKECAVVTHHRLEVNEQGKLVPKGELEEPYIVRPTSEMIIGEAFSRWVQSYRDLPLKINQWANIVRWEMRTRLFLRTCEILWQEGHTVHMEKGEALEQAFTILHMYGEFFQDLLALQPILGVKSKRETFPGAEKSYTLEMMMQDKKALQGGTSHFLGQNFSKSCGIQFQDEKGERKYSWTTSWGVTTRMIGALIMSHSDDDGLVLPCRIAPYQIVILPIFKEENREEILTFCASLQKKWEELFYGKEPLRILVDERDIRGGEKNWSWVKKGVPIRVEIGAREVEEGRVSVLFRLGDLTQRHFYSLQEFEKKLSQFLSEMDDKIRSNLDSFQKKNLHQISSEKEFYAFFEEEEKGFASCFFEEESGLEEKIQKDLGVTLRCFFLEEEEGSCIFTKKKGKKAVFGRAY